MPTTPEPALAPPFDRLFGTRDLADTFGVLARFALETLGVSQDDPLVTLSLRKRRLHLTYGQWLVLGVRSHAQGVRRVTFALPDAARTRFPFQFTSEPFAERDPVGPRVYLAEVLLSQLQKEVQNDREALLDAFGQALWVARARFASWTSSPYRSAHRPDLLAALLDAERWRGALSTGAVSTPNSGAWWVNDLDELRDDEAGNVLWAPSGLGDAPALGASVDRMAPDDLVIQHRDGVIHAIGRVVGAPNVRATHPGTNRPEHGVAVPVESNPVEPTLSVSELPPDVRRDRGPFDAQGAVRSGQAWPLTSAQAGALSKLLRPRLPETALPEVEDLDEDADGGTVADRLADPDVRVVKVAPGAEAKYWDECLNGGFITLGWDELGDLTRFEERPDLIEAYTETFPDSGITPAQHKKAHEIWTFRELRPGDVVLANHGKSAVLALGVVQEPGYSWHPERPYHQHVVPVAWETEYARSVPTQGGWGVSTVLELDSATIALWFPVPVAPTTARHRHHPVDAIATATGLPPAELRRWLRAIERKGQAILYGPPGTGKTFVAEHLARHLVGGGDGLLEVVQFHPAYGYEDFIQGLRPTVDDGSGALSFDLRPGRFLDFVQRAEAREGTSVLIIDEINRANLPRVLGELMYLLEYRGRSVPLAAGGALRVPQNVRIVATMNTADRSIALVDHALRRRFAFLPLRPNLEVLAAFHAGKPGAPLVAGLAGVLTRLHAAIDDPHLHIGISYFLIDDLVADLEDVWRTEIEPYLEELFFDQRTVREEFTWEAVRPQVFGGG